MAKVQKTNNMAFKMKRSPAKNLGDFFGSIFSGKAVKGRQDAQRKRNTGEYAGMTDFEKRRAEKKSRKAGESKFQADVRRKKEKKAEAKKTEAKKTTSVFEPKKFGHEGKDYFGPTTTDLDRALINADLKNKKLNLKSDVFDLSKKPPKAKQTFKQAFAAARKANKKTFDFEGKSYTTKLKKNGKTFYNPFFPASPLTKKTEKNMRNPFKMKGNPMQRNFGISPAKNTRGRLEQKHPTKGNVTGADYEMIRTSDKDRKSYAVGYNVMTKAQKKKHGKPVDGEYVISKSGHIKRIG